MTLLTRILTIVLTLLMCIAEFVTSACANEPTSDMAKSALSKRGYPWYDAKSDSFRPLLPPQAKGDQSLQQHDSNVPVGQIVGPILLMAMWGMLGALIISVLVLIARSMKVVDPRRLDDRQPAKSVVNLETIEALPEPARSVGDLLGEAERLAVQEAFADAITCYYGWQLVQLDRQQSIEVQKGKTNRQYLREVGRTRPELNEVFGASMRLFEDAYFGSLPVSRDAFESVWVERSKFFSTQSRKGR